MAKSKTTKSASNHEFFGHTIDLLGEVWDQLIAELGHTPATAKEKITKAIKEFHKAEAKGPKAKSTAKTPAKQKAKRAISKAKKSVVSKVKKSVVSKVKKSVVSKAKKK